MRKHKKRDLEKITVDRKIVEGLRNGRSLTSLTKSTGKGKEGASNDASKVGS